MTKSKRLKILQKLNKKAVKQINIYYSNSLHPVKAFSDHASLALFDTKIPHFVDSANSVDARANQSLALLNNALKHHDITKKKYCLSKYSNDSNDALHTETMTEMNADLKFIIHEYRAVRTQLKHLKLASNTFIAVYGTTKLIHIITPETVYLVTHIKA